MSMVEKNLSNIIAGSALFSVVVSTTYVTNRLNKLEKRMNKYDEINSKTEMKINVIEGQLKKLILTIEPGNEQMKTIMKNFKEIKDDINSVKKYKRYTKGTYDKKYNSENETSSEDNKSIKKKNKKYSSDNEDDDEDDVMIIKKKNKNYEDDDNDIQIKKKNTEMKKKNELNKKKKKNKQSDDEEDDDDDIKIKKKKKNKKSDDEEDKKKNKNSDDEEDDYINDIDIGSIEEDIKDYIK